MPSHECMHVHRHNEHIDKEKQSTHIFINMVTEPVDGVFQNPSLPTGSSSKRSALSAQCWASVSKVFPIRLTVFAASFWNMAHTPAVRPRRNVFTADSSSAQLVEMLIFSSAFALSGHNLCNSRSVAGPPASLLVPPLLPPPRVRYQIFREGGNMCQHG